MRQWKNIYGEVQLTPPKDNDKSFVEVFVESLVQDRRDSILGFLYELNTTYYSPEPLDKYKFDIDGVGIA